MVDRAVRIAQTKRSVTCIVLPNDLQLMPYEDPPMAHGSTHTGVGFPAESKVPESQGLQAAARVLNEGKKVAMLVGAGCLQRDHALPAGRTTGSRRLDDMDRPPPDPAKLLEAWMEWERGELPPGRVMANLKTGGLRDLLEALVAAIPTVLAVSSPPTAEEGEGGEGDDAGRSASESWTPVV